MNWLFGIDTAASGGASGGERRLEWLAAPSGDRALLALAAAGLAAAFVIWLYRRDARELSRRARAVLTALRLLAVAALALMLMEPALVVTRREQEPSVLPVLVDVSRSMSIRDTYADGPDAERMAKALGWDGGAKALRERTRLALAIEALRTGLFDGLAAAGDRVVVLYPFEGKLSPGVSKVPRPMSQVAPGGAPVASPESRIALGSGPGTSDGGPGTLDSGAWTPAGPATALGSAVREALARSRGTPLAGMLVISDGQSNAGEAVEAAARACAEDRVMVHALAVGTPEGPRNLRVTKLEAGPVAVVRDPVTLEAIVEAAGMAGDAPFTVVLERSRDGGAWEEAARREAGLEAGGRLARVAFEVAEDHPATVDYRVTVTGAGPELTDDDNAAAARVRVVREKIRVLLVAGASFPEVQFLRNALLRDRSVELASWLLSAEPGYEQAGGRPLRRMPATQEELDEFDCVVLHDPDPAAWPPDWGTLLTHFVARAGGGLVFVAGERMTKALFDRAGDPDAAWLSLLPVAREPGLFHSEVSVQLSSREPWKLDVTPEGRQDPLFRFAEDVEANDRIVASLPGMYWHFPVTRARPGATVLARHGDPRMRNAAGGHVLLAAHLFGPGRVVFVGFDSTYRWRYLDEAHFDGFWARMVDRAGRPKLMGGRHPFTLSADRPVGRPGEALTIAARWTDGATAGAAERLQGEVEAGDRAPAALAFVPAPGRPGVFEAAFLPDRPGTYFARVWIGDQDPAAGARPAVLALEVAPADAEFDRPGLDRAALEALARPTGGRVFGLDEAGAIPAAFVRRRFPRVFEDRHDLFDAPALLMLALGAVFAEWVARKLMRLV